MSEAAERPACPMGHGVLELKGGESRAVPEVQNNPFPFYRALRAEQPVYYDEKIDTWLVTRYEDVKTVLLDPVTYSLGHGYQDRYAYGYIDELEATMRAETGIFVRDIIASDPPEHTRLRSLTEKAFTAHRVKTLEPRMEQIVIDLIEEVADRGHADAMADIGGPITARVICDQLGFDINEVGADAIARWSHALNAQLNRAQTREQFDANLKELVAMQKYLIPLVRDREANPKEDMTSDIAHARIEGDPNPTLSFEEKLSIVRALLIAGNDTTAAAIANLLMILALNPELQKTLYECVDDDRRLSRFVEEVLRLEPPAHGLFRTAIKDVELGGVKIPAYSQICVMFASANDDDSEFPCPRELNLERPNVAKHMTFGAGIHRCIGAALSRMEIKVAAREIIKRLDNIQLAIDPSEIRYLPNVALQAVASLPITFTRRKSA